MLDFNNEKYQNTAAKTITQLIDSGTSNMFNDMFTALVAYAELHNIKKPQKGDLLNFLMREKLLEIDPETYFKK